MPEVDILEAPKPLGDEEVAKPKGDVSDILDEVKENFRMSSEADGDEREKALDDLRMLDGEGQWAESVKSQRDLDKRPCLTINKLPAKVDRAMAELRQNKIGIKVSPGDDEADQEVADVIEGLVRAIEYQSTAELAYTWAAECAMQCGRGFYRIGTRYESNETFDQEIYVSRIKNPFSVYFPSTSVEFDLSDGDWGIITEYMSDKDFDRLYPDAQKADYETAEGDAKEWVEKGRQRVAEYFRKVRKKAKLYLLEDGTVTFTPELFPQSKPVEGRWRWSEIITIEWYKVNGLSVLDSGIWPGKYIPIVPVWGKELDIEGDRRNRGLVRNAKDAQRMYNYWRSGIAEIVALSGKAPYIVTKTQIGENLTQWANINKRTQPYVVYTPDPLNPGRPQREQPGQIPTGMANESAYTDTEMNDTMGIYDAYQGKESNETSGVAIEKRVQQSSLTVFSMLDNVRRSVSYGGKIIIDVIPYVYDTSRVLKIMGADQVSKLVKVNDETGEAEPINLKVGKYDNIVTTGPSFDTQKQESVEQITEIMKLLPEEYRWILSDLVIQDIDTLRKDEIVKRIRKLIPPGILDPDETEEGAGGEIAGDGGNGQMMQEGGEEQVEPEVDELQNVQIAQERAKLDGINLANEIKKLELQIKQQEASQPQEISED